MKNIKEILHTKRTVTEEHIKQLQREEKEGIRYTAMIPDVPFLVLGLICDIGWLIHLAASIIYFCSNGFRGRLDWMALTALAFVLLGVAYEKAYKKYGVELNVHTREGRADMKYFEFGKEKEGNDMEQKKVWSNALIFGFVTLFLCGIGDWLIGYEPQGGQELIFGLTNTKMTEVPSWFYVTSMVFGILSGFGCRSYAPVMVGILDAIPVKRESKAYKGFRFGLASAPLMFISFHTACCIALLLIQAALKAGVAKEAANSVFLLPTAVSIIPFAIWCFIVDIPVTVSFVALVLKGKLGLPKWMIICSPLGMSIFMKIIAAVLIASGLGQFAFLTACGESWGHAFMCLAFLMIIRKRKFCELRKDS